MSCLVSVIIPVRNRALRLVEAVESVVAQCDCELEIIIVDDESADDSGPIADALAERHECITTLHRSHGGPAAARNTGVAACRGQWVTFLDSDDLMPPDRISRQVAIISSQNEPVAILGMQTFLVADGVEPPEEKRDEIARGGAHPYTMSMILALDTFQSVGGFDESFSVGEDLEFLMRLQRGGVTIVQCPEVWTKRRIFGDNLIYDHAALAFARARAIRRNRTREEVAR